ncbi:hypothetical protein ACVIU4_000442 [Bradyrhizobium barranii subsp. barranii]|nr:hypothetical protein [Bradyrhizobium japonicum]MCP1963346.1 hypothetical protein [Bradyrhizobium japonicum]
MILRRLAGLHALALALTVAPSALAGPYCTPVSGRDQIAKAGSVCPVGYYASGSCCIALHLETPRAFVRLPARSCPSGTFTSASSYCVSLR